jgi:hypothetical protein
VDIESPLCSRDYELRTEYRGTRNGSFAMESYRLHRAEGLTPPDWCLDYLDGVAERLRAVDTSPTKSGLMEVLELPAIGRDKFVGWREPNTTASDRAFELFSDLVDEEERHRGVGNVKLAAVFADIAVRLGVSNATARRLVVDRIRKSPGFMALFEDPDFQILLRK